jgi:hypothetical protein
VPVNALRHFGCRVASAGIDQKTNLVNEYFFRRYCNE